MVEVTKWAPSEELLRNIAGGWGLTMIAAEQGTIWSTGGQLQG